MEVLEHIIAETYLSCVTWVGIGTHPYPYLSLSEVNSAHTLRFSVRNEEPLFIFQINAETY